MLPQDQDGFGVAAYEMDVPCTRLPLNASGFPSYKHGGHVVKDMADMWSKTWRTCGQRHGGNVVKDMQVFIENPKWLLVKPSESHKVVFKK